MGNEIYNRVRWPSWPFVSNMNLVFVRIILSKHIILDFFSTVLVSLLSNKRLSNYIWVAVLAYSSSSISDLLLTLAMGFPQKKTPTRLVLFFIWTGTWTESCLMYGRRVIGDCSTGTWTESSLMYGRRVIGDCSIKSILVHCDGKRSAQKSLLAMVQWRWVT